jgi:zinc protease
MTRLLSLCHMLFGACVMTAALLTTSTTASASNRVERVVSPGGIEAWLVRQTHLPIIAIDFAVRGGAAQDPPGRPGTASMLAAMMDEGAGDLDSEAFSKQLEERAVEMSFAAGRDTFSGAMRMLSEHRDEAFGLLKLALREPRFDAAPMDRIRQSLLAAIRRSSTNANAIASETFWATAFPGHPYGHRTIGTADSVQAITREDLLAMHRRVVSREHLKIAVVGDITAEELGPILDDVFGGLPAKAELTPVPDVTLAAGDNRRTVALDVPQTVISFGLLGLKRSDPDFIAAFVMNHILGGGSLSSRLYTEVREKRGLAYSVSSSLTALDATGLVTGGTSTRSDRAAESLAVIEAELKRMGEVGPTEEELDQAKRYLVGSWALRFETSNAIAANLIRIQLDGYGPDFLDRRNQLIQAVSIEDVRRVARRLLGDPRLLVVTVGRPAGL